MSIKQNNENILKHLVLLVTIVVLQIENHVSQESNNHVSKIY